MRKRTLLAALVCVAACSSDADDDLWAVAEPVVRDSVGIQIVENHSPVWSDANGWKIGDEPLFVLRGSDGGDENRLLDPTSIDVDSRGRIIVGDGNQVGWDAVLVYDSAGRFQFQAGGNGEGPGEFGQLWWASSYRGDSIVAFDMSGDRLTVFSPEGNFVRMLRTPSLPVAPVPPGTYGFTAGADAAYRDGHFLAYPSGSLDISEGPGPAWYKHLLLRLSPNGAAWDTLGTFEISQEYWSGTSQEQYWFGPVAVSALGPNAFYFGRGDRFEVSMRDATGQVTRIIRRSHEPRPVTEALREQLGDWYIDRVSTSPEVNEQILERLRLEFESGRFAVALPPYSAMLLDDAHNLWIEEFRWFLPNERAPIQEAAQWSVFNPEGVWLGNVETPPGFILRNITHDRVLGFVIDEFDVKEIYAYSLDRGLAR